MKNILITGCSGFIGQYLLQYIPENLFVTGSFNKNKPEKTEINLIPLDLLNVDQFILKKNYKFDCIIHCAAESSLFACEQNQEQAFLVNTKATEKLAKWSSEQKSRFVFLSTDIVFKGDKGNYVESELPDPVNVYGLSKLNAEKIISESHNNAVIIRLALCLGKGLGNSSGFIDWLFSKLDENEQVPLFYDEFRTPVSATFAAQAIWQIALNEYRGIVHLAGKAKTNRYDLTIEILKYLNMNKTHLLKKKSSASSSYQRPKDVSMKSNILSDILNMPQENITDLVKNIV